MHILFVIIIVTRSPVNMILLKILLIYKVFLITGRKYRKKPNLLSFDKAKEQSVGRTIQELWDPGRDVAYFFIKLNCDCDKQWPAVPWSFICSPTTTTVKHASFHQRAYFLFRHHFVLILTYFCFSNCATEKFPLLCD